MTFKVISCIELCALSCAKRTPTSIRKVLDEEAHAYLDDYMACVSYLEIPSNSQKYISVFGRPQTYNMSLIMRDAVPADLKFLVPTQYDAFHPKDLIHVLVYPSPVPPTPEVYQRTISRLEKTFTNPAVRWIKVVDDNTGEIGNISDMHLLSTLL